MLPTARVRLRARLSMMLARAGILSLLLLGGCPVVDGSDDTDKMKTKNTQQAANEFLGQIEAAVAGLAIEREAFEVRVNRCEGRQGETRDDLYYIWVGLRGTARDNDIARQLEDLHARWKAAGWTITRFRRTDGGGVNLAATDPDTGNGYTLDSGFEPAPDAYVVGFFNTPCHRSETTVDFGTINATR